MNRFDGNYHSIVAESSMVVGFISSALRTQLRRMAAERNCSEAWLVSEIVKRAIEEAPTIPREQQ